MDDLVHGGNSFVQIYYHKLLTRAYGTESQLASQGGGLRPKVNIGPIIK